MVDRMKDPLSETLEGALQVDPSREFLARVRQRVATAPPDRSWRSVKIGLAVAGVSAVLAPVGWITATRVEPTTVPAAAIPVLASRDFAPSVVESLVEARDTSLTHQPLAWTEPTPPSVLIPRSELAAFRQWISRAQSGSFGFASVPEAVPVEQEVSVPEITLMPIGLSDSLE
jgi:hypothetical protein